jgi:translation initiation factor IF-2
LGLTGVPGAGEILTVVENEARAREVAAFRKEQAKLKRTTQAPVSVDNMFSALAANRAKEYAVVVKADVQGSVEAIVNALHKISTDEIKVRVLQSGVGAITESDVTLANATKAPIIGFNVRPNAKAREIAQREKTRFKYFDVIYHLTEDVAKEMAGILGPEIIETVVGRAKIQEVFNAGKKGQGRWSARPRRPYPQGLSHPPYPRRCHRLEDRHRFAASFQGRCRRSSCGPRMRRRASGYQRHQGGRYARNL